MNSIKYTALYCRISKEETLSIEGNSIESQKTILMSYAAENNLRYPRLFIDDGYSGTDFDRPALNQILSDVENSLVSAVVVKDLSRFGRDYIKVGYYLEIYFPSRDVRFIAINDAVDSDNGIDMVVPFKNIMNEMYAKEVSQKVRTTVKLKGNSGEPLAAPPYGYKKDLNNPQYWIVDPIASKTVRRIFNLYIAGNSIPQIIDILEKEKIVTPQYYHKIITSSRSQYTGLMYRWSKATISKILFQQEYLGDIINFKTYSLSYKDKTRLKNDQESLAIFPGVHEPIITKEVWDRAQEIKQLGNSRRKNAEGPSLFSGLLVCSDCGAMLNYHYDQKNPNTQYYNCSTYNNAKVRCGKSHYIRLDFLSEIMLSELKQTIHYAQNHPDTFACAVENNSFISNRSLHEDIQKELEPMLRRNKELDILFSKLFEDKVKGVISEERFSKLAGSFQQEQTELEERIKALKAQMQKAEEHQAFPAKFISLIETAKRIAALDRELLFKFIDHIEVFHVEPFENEKIQTVKIHYNYVGFFETPTAQGDVITTTPRKGIFIKYLRYSKYLDALGREN